MRKPTICVWILAHFLTALICESIVAQPDIATLDQKRAVAIATALQVSVDQVALRHGTGKVDADQTHKLSYFIFTENPADPASQTKLVPLATSRFDPYNYSSNEWWYAHKDEIARARERGQPIPRQDPAEVSRYLAEHNLSTNPDVLIISLTDDPNSPQISKIALQTFLLEYFLGRATDDGFIEIYRGAERPSELASWQAGTIPRGASYWTPDATYAWRYARKNSSFILELVRGEAPLFKFRVPVATFREWVTNDWIVLGCEMTKRAHEGFSRSGVFQDHLAEGGYYMGDGKLGLEVEIRAKHQARQKMTSYYAGPISIAELASERRLQIERGIARLRLQYPEQVDSLMSLQSKRITMIDAEQSLLEAVQSAQGAQIVTDALSRLPSGTPEITNVDGFSLRDFARTYSDGVPPKSLCEQLTSKR